MQETSAPETLALTTPDPRILIAAQDWWYVLAPPPNLTVSQWADRERVLSAEASAEPGKWDTSRAEYQRGILDAVSDATVETVVVMSSAQVGKTEIVNNIAGFHIDQDPAPLLNLQPTLEMADTWSKDRLAPMLRDTPALRGKVNDPKARNSGNTKRHKSFVGGHITMAGANSPASLASRPIRVVLADEVDRFPPSAGTEGDPVSLARKRTTTFWNRKIILISTPTIKGASRIEKAWAESDMRRFFVPCPACGTRQTLKWSQVRWDNGDATTAYYICEAPDCGAWWEDAERWDAVRRGEWRAERPEKKGTAGFHLNELYSPWVHLAETVQAFLDAQGDPERLKVWTNTAMGELWEEKGEEVDKTSLFARAQARGWRNGGDDEARTAPAAVLVITCGVDVQADRLEIERVGWGLQEESWSIEHKVIYGDLSTNEPWNELDEYLLTPTTTEDGRELRVEAAAVDSGGNYTDAVYRFAKNKLRRRVWAIKGDDGPRPIWPKLAAKKAKFKQLFIVGVDTAKDVIYGRLRLTEPGPGFCHFPTDRDQDWFDQLTGEIVVTKHVKGFPVRVWQPKRECRHEALDCRVYALAALRSMAISWGKVRRLMMARGMALPEAEQPEEPAPAAADDPKQETPPAPPPPKRRMRRQVVRSSFMSH